MSEEPIKLTVTNIDNIHDDLACFSMAAENGLSDFIPGQVAVLSLDGQAKSYFAIASAPGEDTLSFLVKRGSGVSGALFEQGIGSSVLMTGPVGKGFPITEYRGHDPLLMAAGTAIAPIRSVIRSVLAHRHDYGKVILIYGVREPAHFAFQDEVESWRDQSIMVVLTCSQPGSAAWNGAVGYVQHRLEDVAEHLERPVALICGMKEMMQQTSEELTRRFPGIQVLT